MNDDIALAVVSLTVCVAGVVTLALYAARKWWERRQPTPEETGDR